MIVYPIPKINGEYAMQYTDKNGYIKWEWISSQQAEAMRPGINHRFKEITQKQRIEK